jgi:hypothetical protein
VPLDRQVVRLLADARRPVEFRGISAALAPRATRSAVLDAVEALRRRSLVECSRTGGGLMLQSVMTEYVADGEGLAPAA